MNEHLPLISIVRPNYNGGIFVEQAIISILRQCYQNYEILVMDGGSHDMSRYIFSKYAEYFSYFRSHKDDGQYHAINEGFSLAKGEIFMWLNSDDLLHPGALRAVARSYEENASDYGLFTGLPTLIDATGRVVRVYHRKFRWSHEYFMKINPFEGPHYLQQESTFFSRLMWDKISGLQASKYSLAADFDLWLRMTQFTEILEIDCLVGGFRQHTTNRSKAYAQYAKEVVESQNECLQMRRLRFDTDKTYKNRKEHSQTKTIIAKENNHFSIAPTNLFTSLAPKNIDLQTDAVESWIANGFNAISLNCHSETSGLQSSFKGIKFEAPLATLEMIYGKPLVSIYDFVLKCSTSLGISGIINSDIRFLTAKSLESLLTDAIWRHADNGNALFLFSRLEIGDFVGQVSEELSENGLQPYFKGYVYGYGFDLMLANQDIWKRLLPLISVNTPLGMGVPWWDYYLPLIALSLGIKLVVVSPTPIGHLYHDAEYSRESWVKASIPLLELIYSDLPSCEFPSTDNQLPADNFLDGIARQVIKHIHANAMDLDLGQYVRPMDSMLISQSHENPLHLSFVTTTSSHRMKFEA